MIIHILAGSKGGIGKTRCSISLSLYYLKEKKVNISLFDANSNNIDFFTIMTGTDYLFPIEMTRDFKKEEVGPIQIVRGKGKGANAGVLIGQGSMCYVRKHPFELYKGINDFWMYVRAAAENSIAEKRECLVVDTNLAIPNLISADDNTREETRRIFEKLASIGVAKIFVWYVWCLNDFLGTKNNLNAGISRLLTNLEKSSQNLFSVQSNLIHVLNPYLFFKKKWGIMELVDKIGRSISGYLSVDITKIGLPFDVAIKVFTAIIKAIVEQKAGRLDKDALKRKIDEINNSRLNFVVLEESQKNLYYIKEQLIQIGIEGINNKAVRNIEEIHKDSFGENTIWEKLKTLETHGIIC